MTPQERSALGVIVLLLVAGGLTRHLTQPEPVQWLADAPAGAAEDSAAGALGQRVEREVGRAQRRSLPLGAGERIDLNTADTDELQRLPRVGPSLAARIAAHREAHGQFRSLADLDAVSGVGPAVLEAVSPHVDLPAAPTARPPAPTPPVASRGAAVTGSRAATPAAGPVDLNTAGAEELQRLPGIGPALAGRIVEWRTQHGRFRSVPDLAQVPGIGPRTVERLEPLVRATP